MGAQHAPIIGKTSKNTRMQVASLSIPKKLKKEYKKNIISNAK